MSGRVVLFGRERFTTELGWTELAALLPGWAIRGCPPDAVASHLDDVDVICPFGAWIDAAVLDAGTFGLEKIDVGRATELGVLVARIPGDATGNADSVAEFAVLQLLTLVRRLDEARAALSAGAWEFRPTGGSLLGATVAIVGLGAIGTALARRLVPFGAHLLGVRAHPDLGGPAGMERVSGPDQLPAVLAQADAVVCCASFEVGSAQLFGPAAFAAMRPGTIFVNVARGGLVDETALLAALESGQVGGAGLDVHAVEPADPRTALLSHPRVLGTPHVAALTEVMFRRTGAVFAENVLRWAAGEEPRWAANAPASRRAGRGAG